MFASLTKLYYKNDTPNDEPFNPERAAVASLIANPNAWRELTKELKATGFSINPRGNMNNRFRYLATRGIEGSPRPAPAVNYPGNKFDQAFTRLKNLDPTLNAGRSYSPAVSLRLASGPEMPAPQQLMNASSQTILEMMNVVAQTLKGLGLKSSQIAEIQEGIAAEISGNFITANSKLSNSKLSAAFNSAVEGFEAVLKKNPTSNPVATFLTSFHEGLNLLDKKTNTVATKQNIGTKGAATAAAPIPNIAPKPSGFV